jgi:uncharacterized RDD family membrane protein YckC
MIDSLFQWILVILLWIALWVLGDITGMWLMLILCFCINWFYHTAWEVFSRGQSPGKRIMGIRVVQADGSPVNPGASFLRNLLRFADTFMFLIFIALLSITASPGFRRLGDWAADTLVVYTANSRSSLRLRTGSIDIPPVQPPKPLSYQEKQTILMFARRYPLLGKARADEIAWDYARELCGAGLEESPSACLLGIARSIGGDAG